MNSASFLRLANQTAIVTGAGSGIGAGIAKAFASQGCNVLVADCNRDAVKNTVNNCKDLSTVEGFYPPAQIDYILCDVTKKAHVIKMIERADELAFRFNKTWKEHYIRENSNSSTSPQSDRSIYQIPPPVASVLVNCAGITRDNFSHNISEYDYDQVLDVNLKGTFLSCQAFCQPNRIDTLIEANDTCEEEANTYQNMVKSSLGGSIINISSIVAEAGNVGQVNYAASKGGVKGLTRALAKEMAYYSARFGANGEREYEQIGARNPNCIPPTIRVNAIQPGFIDTPMSNAVPFPIREQLRKKIALKRFGSVDDVANMALFLSSSVRCGYVTGECWECSGMISL